MEKKDFNLNQIQDTDIELVKAWIGTKHQELYLKKYYNGDLGFNFLAFLLPDIVFLTRKMWIESFIIIVLDILFLWFNGGIPYPVALFIRLILGFAYYPLYSASIKRKIKKYKLQGLSYEQQFEKAIKTGGDKITLTVLVAILLVVIVGILLCIRILNLAHSNIQKSNERANELIKKWDDEAANGTHLDSLEEYIGKAINTDKYGQLVNYVSKIEKKSNKELKWRLFYQGKNKTFLIMDKLSAKPIKPSKLYDKTGETRYTDGSKVGEVGKKLNPMLLEQKPEFFTESNESENIRYLAWMTDTENELWTQFKDEAGIAEYAIGGPSIELFTESFNRTASTRARSNTIKIEIGTYGYEEDHSSGILSSSYNNGIYFKNEMVWLASPGSVYVKSGGDLMGTCLSKDFYNIANYHVYSGEAYVRPIVCIATDDFNKKFDFIDE